MALLQRHGRYSGISVVRRGGRHERDCVGRRNAQVGGTAFAGAARAPVSAKNQRSEISCNRETRVSISHSVHVRN